MNPKIPPSPTPGTTPYGWYGIQRLLLNGEYHNVVALLEEAQLCIAPDDAATSSLLHALHELCLAGQQCQSETDWHHQALSSAQQREQTLKEQSLALLDRIAANTDGALRVPENFESPQPTPRPCGADVAPHASSATPPTASFKTVLDLGQQLQDLCQEFRHLWQTQPLCQPCTEQVDELESQDCLLLELERFFNRSTFDEVSTGSTSHRHTPSFQQDSSAADRSPGPLSPPMDPASKPSTLSDPVLYVYCLGSFRVYQDDQPVEPWPSSKGLSIFKYLVTHRTQPVFKEVLMELFWPGSDPESARNNLNVALHGLRKALRTVRPEFDHVLYENDQYFLNPEMIIWIDADEFEALYATGARQRQAGDVQKAMEAYRAAVPLYLGEFLADDRYVEWLLPRRQQVQKAYLNMLEDLSQFHLERHEYEICIHLSQKLLEVDACCEEAHRYIMHCYAEQGQRHLALRQYHQCVETLAIELDIEPDEPTQALYDEIRHQK